MAPPADRPRSHRAGRIGARLAALLLALGAGSAASAAAPLDGSRQLVLVTTAGWDANQGTLRYYQRQGDDGTWRPAGAFAVAVGRNGSAWGTGLHAEADLGEGPRKREGDGRSPAGAFAIGPAFGYAAQAGTAVAYLPLQASHWCMDVPASPHYNRIVDAREVGEAAVAGSSEPMRLDLHRDGDPRYRLGLVIGHNPDNVPPGGSCIFAHLWRRPGEATAGCTAMADADMETLLGWLDPAAQPRFVLLPEAEHARLASEWQLPAAQEVVR